ncbi:hypothetical protein HC081234_23370 [Helicobacter cinaedi]|nr:hypothetical protein HC081234_23370 [Helicobacter cinaedi]
MLLRCLLCAFAGVCSVGSVICVQQTPFTSTLTTHKIITRYFRIGIFVCLKKTNSCLKKYKKLTKPNSNY